MRTLLSKYSRSSICMCRCADRGSTISTSSVRHSSRAYPSEPRVGVGVVVFRNPFRDAEERPQASTQQLHAGFGHDQWW